MNDKKLGIILLLIVVLLLGVTFYFNVSGSLDSLADPLVGQGLGVLCDNEEECISFCSNNMGQCVIYCDENPENELCGKLIGLLRRK